MIIGFVLSLIAFGSTLAFNDVVSLSLSSCYVTYMMGNGLLLWRRITGQIRPYSPESTELTNTVKTDSLSWGPWKVPGLLGILVNVIGLVFLFVVTIFSFFPTGVQPDPSLMNWSVFMFGVTMLFSVAWYVIAGHKDYDGPRVEFDLLREEAVVSFEKGSDTGAAL